jgi:hypothetical protein
MTDASAADGAIDRRGSPTGNQIVLSGAPGAALALFRLSQVTGQGQAAPQQEADGRRR